VYVEGSLRTRKYTDKNGVEKYATDIRADSMQMLGSRQGMGGPSEDGGGGGGAAGGGYAPRQAPARPAAAPAQRPAAAPKPAASNFDDMDDDIPF
jgi:single-strand DNA-binding protein